MAPFGDHALAPAGSGSTTRSSLVPLPWAREYPGNGRSMSQSIPLEVPRIGHWLTPFPGVGSVLLFALVWCNIGPGEGLPIARRGI